jgi:hypothetical protein
MSGLASMGRLLVGNCWGLGGELENGMFDELVELDEEGRVG